MKYNPSDVTLTINGQELLGFADNVSITLGVYKIYGKENCEYCEKAKNLLDSKGIRYQYLEVGKDVTKEQLVAICEAFGVTPKTVPQIFRVVYDETVYVGGYSELVKFL